MISSKTYNYVVEAISRQMSVVYPKFTAGRPYGRKDVRVDRTKVVHLCGLFEQVLYHGRHNLGLVRYYEQRGEFYVYNGCYYENVGGGLVFLMELIKRVLNNLRVNGLYGIYAAKTIATEVYQGIVNSDECVYLPDRNYIIFTNGVLDVKLGRLREFDMKFCTDIILDISYNPQASCLLWEHKIREIIPNKAMREGFQQFCGALLIKRDELKFEYICYLIGSGANGKSVAAAAIVGVFGEDYVSRYTPYDLFKASDSKISMAELDGKLLNLTDDLDSRDVAGGQLKKFASGEKFQARKLYGNPNKIQAPLMLCCANTMPDSSDDSYGNHRRLLPIFTTLRQWTEKDKDPYLTAKLTTPEARERIFIWIYEGYKKIIRNNGNIVLGEEILKAQADLVADSSSLRRWARDMGFMRAVPTGRLDCRWYPLKALYASYVTYAKDMGYYDVKSSNELSRLLKSMNIERDRRSDNKVYYCVGRRERDTDDEGNYHLFSDRERENNENNENSQDNNKLIED